MLVVSGRTPAQGREGKVVQVYRRKWVIHIERITREKVNGELTTGSAAAGMAAAWVGVAWGRAAQGRHRRAWAPHPARCRRDGERGH